MLTAEEQERLKRRDPLYEYKSAVRVLLAARAPSIMFNGTRCYASVDVKLCPFCQSYDLECDMEDDDKTKYAAAIICRKCFASGPISGWYRTTAEAFHWAIQSWNKRKG